MSINKPQLGIDPGLASHYAAIGRAAVEAAVAEGAKPNDEGEVDVKVKLTLNVGKPREGMKREGPRDVCCICVRRGNDFVCEGTCCM